MYPFGFGLSYTAFKYGALKLSTRRVKRGEGLCATVTVTNAGTRAADEVVQMYLTDNEASAPTPRWALKAFQRVTLRPRQAKTVRFEITPAMLALINAQGEAVIEPGAFTLTVGGASPVAFTLASAFGSRWPTTRYWFPMRWFLLGVV